MFVVLFIRQTLRLVTYITIKDRSDDGYVSLLLSLLFLFSNNNNNNFIYLATPLGSRRRYNLHERIHRGFINGYMFVISTVFNGYIRIF